MISRPFGLFRQIELTRLTNKRLFAPSGTKSGRTSGSAADAFWNLAFCALFAFGTLLTSGSAFASPISQPKGQLWALDKISGRVHTLNMAIGDRVTFGDLEVELVACFRSPPDEPPESMAHLIIRDVLPRVELELLFEGWMFASSPGLHSLEHPIYDVWLSECSGADE